MLPAADAPDTAPLKWTLAISIAVKYGRDTDTMKRRTKAQKRKMIPGMQNVRDMAGKRKGRGA